MQIDTARTCLQHSVALHGEGSVELVQAYSLLAAAHLGQGKLHEAEELLATANWAVVRAGDAAPPAERSRVARGFGRLNSARGDHSLAAQSFAEAIYEVSLAAGPESVDAAHILFELGQTFDAAARDAGAAASAETRDAAAAAAAGKALACYDKAVSSWYRALQSSRGDGSGPPSPHLAPYAVLCEGVFVLERCAAACASSLGEGHTAVFEAKFTLALLRWALGQAAAAEALCAEVVAAYTDARGPDDESTVDARATLEQIQDSTVLST